MRERRRLRLAKRQVMLARVARREAMTSLAGTLDELEKSTSLVDRSRTLASDYSARQREAGAADLRELQRLACGLAGLAVNAEQARLDARQQADWQSETLAVAENKYRKLQDYADDALEAVRRADAARAEPIAPTRTDRLARKLQTEDQPSTQFNSRTNR
ncbi:MAG: hypothetical protein AAF941_01920 [Pseudomonadota bacterium]